MASTPVWVQRGPLTEPGLSTGFTPYVYVPVRAVGCDVLDNGGDPIAKCMTPQLAHKIAALLNQDSGVYGQ
jgi:hypothetical protein